MGNVSPAIGVWQDKYVKGVISVDGPHVDKHGSTFTPVAASRLPMVEALQKDHDTDAHFTCYALTDGEQYEDFPLLRKQALSSVRKHGGDVLLTAICLDWDVPGHAPLDDEYLASFLNLFETATEADPRLADWHAWYTTRHGARICYALETPVPVDDGERYIVSIIKAFKDQGLLLDESCRDWTRRFRLPLVLRDGSHTREEPLHILETEGRLLDVTVFPKGTHKALARVRTFTRADAYPTQEECLARIEEESDKGRKVGTRFYLAAKKVLKTTSYYEYLIAHDTPLPEEDRHTFLMQMLGVITPRLMRSAYAKPEDIFALLYIPVSGWDPQSCEEDPHLHAWTCVQDIYEKDLLVFNEEQVAIADKEETAESHLQKMAEGMRQWHDAVELQSKDEDVVHTFVKGHMFANHTRFFIPLNEHGRYEDYSVTKDQIVPFIRKSHIDGIIDTWKNLPSGERVGVSPMEIVNQHSTIIQSVKALPQMGDGGMIEDMDGWKPQLVLPMYRRSPFLKAKYNEEVDGWLRAFFGEHYEDAAKWIGYALAFEDGPICAMSIMGKSGTGKKLLSMGLSECLEVPFIIPARSIGATHNDALKKSPFLLVNEAWPAMLGSPSDRFKELTAGDAIHVEPKFMPLIEIVNPLRILFTANNHDLLYELTRGRDLTPDDKQAIGERLYHVDIPSDAIKYLWDLGGPGHTAKAGARWIRGDTGQASDYIVAKHFLWLFENRPKRDGRERFCMMGNCGEDSAEMFQMATQSDTMPMVMRALALMFENVKTVGKKGTLVEDGKIYVTRYGVLDVLRDSLEERVVERSLESCLNSLTVTMEPLMRDEKEYIQLDPTIVLRYSAHWGLDCPNLRKIVGKGNGKEKD